METNESVIKYTISNHCKQRYAERIMGKDDNIDINRFITLNEEKIQTDISKMINYGELIYTGRQTQKDGKGNILDVFLKDTWVILVDSRTKNVITLFKIDLCLGDEFNEIYVSKMIEKLNANKENLARVQQQTQEESNTYKEMIDEAEIQIKDYKSMIKNLEGLCEGYRAVIENNNVKVTQANKDVADVVNTMIGRKEF